MNPFKLELEFHSGKEQKVISVDHHTILLYNTHLRYSYNYTASEHENRDESMPMVELSKDGKGVYPRRFITAIEMNYQQTAKLYKIVIFVNAVPEDLFFYYKRRSMAEETFELIQKYITQPEFNPETIS